MRIRITTKKSRQFWHRWFAWRPIRLGFYVIWLETVERKWVRPENHMGAPRWEYRVPQPRGMLTIGRDR